MFRSSVRWRRFVLPVLIDRHTLESESKASFRWNFHQIYGWKSNRTKFRREVTRLDRYLISLGESLNSFPFCPLFSSFLTLQNFSAVFPSFLFLFRPFASYLGYPMHDSPLIWRSTIPECSFVSRKGERSEKRRRIGRETVRFKDPRDVASWPSVETCENQKIQMPIPTTSQQV